MALMLALPLIMAQLGPNAGIGAQQEFDIPPEITEKQDAEARRRMLQTVPVPSAPVAEGCSGSIESDPAGAVEVSRNALATAIGEQRVRAGLCLGMALTALGQWSEAVDALIGARDAALGQDHASRARLGAMAASAALAESNAERALSILDAAQADAKAADDKGLLASILVDRARALVAQGQPLPAAQALTDARTADPANAQAWLLAATLSRRLKDYDRAEVQIEQAAVLAPQDAEVGLEAGVIAMLTGKEEAARRSWQSVVDLDPQGDAANTARGYLAQLGPRKAPAGAASGEAKTP